MNSPIISFVVAMSKQTRAIGKNQDLLWRIPEDMQHFKKVTMGHPMIMGSKTFTSIGRVLPGRTNIVLTRDPNWHHAGVMVCHTIENAIKEASKLDEEEICIIGGGEIFSLALPYATRIYLTLVDDPQDGDAYFPEYQDNLFTEVARVESSFEKIPFTILTLDRI